MQQITCPMIEVSSFRVGVSLPSLRRKTDPVSETLCFPVFRIPDDGQSPETQ
jgi:hypothetical protein